MADVLPAEAVTPESTMPEAKPKSAKSDSTEIQGLYFGTQEQTFQQSSYYPDSFKKPYNPDELVQRDFTYKIYEDMLLDDQVNVALQLKKDLVVGSGWHISSTDEDVKQELEAILCDEPERALSEILQDMIQAYEFGFSISEKIFKNLADGRLALKDIKPRHPSTWLLHTDQQGNMTRYEQRGVQNSIDVDPNSIIHYVNNSKFQNPYGKSDLAAAYQAYMTKRHVSRFYAIFLENAAGPKPIAKYDRRAPQVVVDDIFNAIKKLQTKSALVIPKDFEMDYLETSNSGEAYIKGINLFNMFIGRSLFIPDLIGFTGGETGGGSFSLGKEQIGLFYKHIYRRREMLERIMDQHIIRPLCAYNYGSMKEYPKFKFNPLSDEDATKQAEMWIKGIQGIGYEPTLAEVNHFRDLIKFPEAEEELVMKGASLPGQGPDATPGQESTPPTSTEEPGQKIEEVDKQAEASKEGEAKKFGLLYPISSLPGDYKKKVDFKAADLTMKAHTSQMLTELQPIVDDIFEDLYSQLQKKKIIENQDLDKAETIQLKYLSKMQTVFKKHFRRLHDDGMQMAKNEVRKSNLASDAPAESLANDEFLNFLEQETYKYVGDWSYGITKKTKEALTAAIKDGRPLSSVIDVMDNKGKQLSDVSLERYSRTKTTEVFNRGRREYFDSTGVVDAYQYSAILDDVTSEICGELNGLTFPKETCPTPPLHFNCRSVLIPITKYEDWSEDGVTNSGKNVDKFLEDKITDPETGNGFAVYRANDEPIIVEPIKYIPPNIGDAGVSFKTEIDGNIEITTYSKDKKAFTKVVTVYDESHARVLSCEETRLDDETKV